jgi:prepilin peptidase CpaA
MIGSGGAAPDHGPWYPAMETALEAAILALAIGAFTTAAWDDLWARRIPNALPLAIAALALVQLIPAGDPYPALWTIVAAAVVFVVAFVQWRLGLLGGGDAKLLAAAALLVGYHDLFRFLFVMSLCGAAVAAAVMAASRLGGPSPLLLPFPGASGRSARPSIPYGTAIAAAAMWVLIQQYPLSQ